MEADALYFPYIKVPKSAWFTRILLYWDKVGAIIPSDYVTAHNIEEPAGHNISKRGCRPGNR